MVPVGERVEVVVVVSRVSVGKGVEVHAPVVFPEVVPVVLVHVVSQLSVVAVVRSVVSISLDDSK